MGVINEWELILKFLSLHPATGLELALDHANGLSDLSILHVLFHLKNHSTMTKDYDAETNYVCHWVPHVPCADCLTDQVKQKEARRLSIELLMHAEFGSGEVWDKGSEQD